jgi:DNA-binding MarR family transcriptional regulator
MKRNSNTCEESTLLFDVWLVTHLTARLLDDALRPLGLTGDEFGLYSLIYSFGPATPTQISRWTGMAPTTVSGMVRRITTRGHATHAPNPDDARSRLLRLSDDGLRVTAEAATLLAGILPRLHSALDTGPAAVRAGLRDIDTGLRRLLEVAPRPYDPPPAGRPNDRTTIPYEGARLTEAQTTEVATFIDWLHARDRTPPPDAAPRRRTPRTDARWG